MATNTWTGDAGDDNWTSPDNWSLDHAPQSSESVVIGAVTVDIADSAVVGATLTNGGTIDMDTGGGQGGSSMTITGAVNNSGALNIGSGNLGSATTANVGSVNNAGGTINLTGTTFLATLDVTSGAAGFGTADDIIGNVNLQGDAVVEFAGTSQITDVVGALALVGSQSRIADIGTPGSNSALQGLTTIGGTLDIRGDTLTTTSAGLANTGSLLIDWNYDYGDGHWGGSNVTINGTLTNSGTTDIGSSNSAVATNVTVGGINNSGGTLNVEGASVQTTLDVTGGSAGFGTTAGQAIGNVYLQGDAVVEFAGASQITDVVGSLALAGSQSRIADIGTPGSNSALKGLTTIGGTLDIRGDTLTTTSAGLTNSGSLLIDWNYDYGDGHWGGSNVTINGTLTNSGTTDIGSSNSAVATNVTVGGINNSGGTLNVEGASVQTTLDVTGGSAGFGTTAGQAIGNVYLQGDAVVEFAGASQITDVVGSLALAGSQSRIADIGTPGSNSALKGLTTIGGTLDIRGDTLTTTSAGLTNDGALDIDSNYDYGDGHWGGSNVTINGTLTNSGTTDIGSSNSVVATNVTVGGINNSGGTLNVEGASVQTTLDVTGGSAGFGTTAGQAIGNVYLQGDAVVEFAGASQITDVVGSLALAGSQSRIADIGTPGSNSALKGLTTIGGTLDIRGDTLTTTSAGLTNDGTLDIDSNYDYGDGHWGGSNVTINGTLTNTDTVNVGDSNLGVATSATVGAFNNTGGTLSIVGTTVQTTLDVTGGAAGLGTAGDIIGNVYLQGDAVVEFAGTSQISDVVGSLSLAGSQSRIADIGTPGSNSALKGLTTIAGTLDIRGDTLTTTSAGLTNNGTLDIDLNYDYGDGHWGGSNVTINGTLTNSGTVNIGDTNLGLATLVTLGGLANAGTINLTGTSSIATTLTISGAATNSGTISANGYSAVSDGGLYSQTSSGTLELGLVGTSAGQFATLSATGGLFLTGGELYAALEGVPLAAGETFDLATFTSGELTGLFNTLDVNGVAGNGVYDAGVSGGLSAGLVYNDSTGNIQLQIINTPTTQTETWTTGTGSWGTTADWSNGAPIFYSNVTIGSVGGADVTLSTDATIDSLTIDTTDTLTTSSGTDLTVGGALSLVSGATISAGGKVAIGGGASISGTISGAGELVLDGGATTIASPAAISIASWIVGDGTTTITESLSYSGNFTLVPGAIFSVGGNTLTLTGTSTLEGAVSGAGSLELGGGSTTIASAAALSVASWTISGSGTSATLTENLTYGGTFIQGAGSKFTIANGETLTLTGSVTLDGTTSGFGTLALTGSASATVSANASASGGFTESAGSTLSIASGDTLTLTGTTSLAGTVSGAGSLDLGGGSATIASGAALTVVNLSITGDGTATIAENLTYAGNFLEGPVPTLAIDSGDTLTLTGTSSVEGKVSGAGTLDLGGGLTTITSDAAFTVANWTISGSGTGVTLSQNLSYAGTFTQDAGSKLSVTSGHTLTLTGSAALDGTTTGFGTVSLSGSASATVSANVGFASGFMLSTGTTLSIASGDTVTLTGTTSLGGAVSGAGTLDLGGGGATIASGAALTVSNLSVSGSETMTIAENLTYAGKFFAGAAPTLVVDSGDTLTLTGTSNLYGKVSGAGTLDLGGGSTTITSDAAFSVATWTISGSGTTATVSQNLSYAGAFTLGAGSKLTIASGDTLTLTGSGTLDAMITGLGTLALSSSASATVSANATDSGEFTQSTGSTVSISTGDTLTLDSATSLGGTVSGAGTLDLGGGSATIASGAALTVANWSLSGSETTTIAENLTYAGKLIAGAAPTVAVDSGDTLTLKGTSTLDGKVSGAGELTLGGGSTTIGSGAALTVADWSLSGSGTGAALSEDLTYSGVFSEGAGDVFVLSGGYLLLSGTDTFSGGTIGGSNTLYTEGTTSVSGLTIGGTAEWENTASVTQNGGNAAIGNSSGQAATLRNTSSGTYDITSDNGIGIGTSASSSITNQGLFEKTGGTQASIVSPAVTNTGTMLVSSGTLDLAAAVTGTGTDTISGASTLEFDASAALGQTIGFTGAGGVLDITSPGTFSNSATSSAKISGFDTTGSNDTIELTGSWSVQSYVQNSGTSGTLTLASGGDDIGLTLLGNYSAGTFNPNGSGANTLVTYTP